MNRDNIIKYIRQPGRLDQNTLPEIEELVNAFPYFQTAYLLHVKNHHNIKSLKFSDSLKSASARIGDRSVLYHLIHGLFPENLHDSQAEAGLVKPLINREEPESGATVTTVTTKENEPVSLDIPVTEKQEELKIPEKSSYTFTGWFEHLDEKAPEEEENIRISEKHLKDKEIIDAFIITQPRFVPGKTVPVNQEDISEAFIKPEDQLMTETLAQIYFNQGYYLKAIHVYEKLSLKFPEKNSYFAAQINKIKQCIS